MTEKKSLTQITFDQLGLSESTLAALKKKGFEHPTPIQALTIPVLLAGKKDIIGQAQTGTGKTAAFALPLIDMLKENANGVQAIILTPTRELALQVATEIDSLKGNKRLDVLPVYGGQSIVVQLQRLRRQVDIVVGTPGRVSDHLERKTLRLDTVTHVILDEADEMLNMGFEQDVKAILEHTPKNKQVILFSATMAPEILKIAQKYMGDYEVLKVAQTQATGSMIEQMYYEVNQRNRFNALCRIVDSEDHFYGLVFCRTKMDTERVARKLADLGYHADALNGDMSQSAREKILNRFKKRQITILVATDVAARGIDVQDVTHVVNYALPEEPEAYVHRIGRTGRAGKTGKAISFASGGDQRKLQVIERKTQSTITRKRLPKPEEIMAGKEQSIINQIQESLTQGSQDQYRSIAAELLKNNDAQEIVGALLAKSFKAKFDVSRYTMEEEPSRSRDDFDSSERSERRERPRFGGERSGSRSGGRSGDRSGSRSGGRFGDRPRSSERSSGGERSSERSGDRPRSSERSGDRSRPTGERSSGAERSSERSGGDERSGERRRPAGGTGGGRFSNDARKERSGGFQGKKKRRTGR